MTSDTLQTSGRPARRRHTLLAAAVALAGLGASPAWAQQRVNQQGDALDANNRVGEGRSYGTPRGTVNDRFRLGNDLVTRDVTGGHGFRDVVPYGNARGFRDFTAGRSSSQFAGYSSGATASGLVVNNAQYTRPYYGGSHIVSPPSDYARLPGTGGYVPPSALRPFEARNQMRAMPTLAGRATAIDPQVNTRLSAQDADRSTSEFASAYWNTPGAREPLLSPDASRDAARDNGRTLSPYTQLSRDARLEPLTQERISQLRAELLRDAAGHPLSPEALDDVATDRTALGGARPVDSQAEGGAPLESQADTARQRLDETLLQNAGVRVADPAEQSSQYAQLQERLRQFREAGAIESLRPVGAARTSPLAPEQPAEPAEPDESGQTPAQPPGQTPGAQPAQPTQPIPGLPDFFPAPMPRSAPPWAQQPAAPIEIRSFADGVGSETLKRVYTQAEQLMDEGRFVSAISRYDAAERLVPNQPLTLMGRATAELGAGYYRRSAASFQRAFAQSPELLMARLNLAELIGEKRLAEVKDTLGQRVTAEPQDPDPAFLAGFIAYHSGDLQEAGRLLTLAQERSGDPFYSEIARHWGITFQNQSPASQPPATRPSIDD